MRRELAVLLQHACRGVVTESNVVAGMVGSRRDASYVAAQWRPISVADGAGWTESECAIESTNAHNVNRLRIGMLSGDHHAPPELYPSDDSDCFEFVDHRLRSSERLRSQHRCSKVSEAPSF